MCFPGLESLQSALDVKYSPVCLLFIFFNLVRLQVAAFLLKALSTAFSLQEGHHFEQEYEERITHTTPLPFLHSNSPLLKEESWQVGRQACRSHLFWSLELFCAFSKLTQLMPSHFSHSQIPYCPIQQLSALPTVFAFFSWKKPSK